MLLSIISNIVMLRVTCCVSVLTCRWHTLWSSSSAARLLSPTSRSADLYSSSAVAAPPENTRRVESQSLFRTPELVKPNRGGLLRCWRRCGDPEWRQTSPGGPWNHTHPECSVFTGLHHTLKIRVHVYSPVLLFVCLESSQEGFKDVKERLWSITDCLLKLF